MTAPPPRRGYGWLLGSTVGAAMGDGLSMTALPLLIASQTRDPLVVSLLQVASGLPWLLFGLAAGALVDRWDRRTVMWRTDLARVGVALALGLLVVLDRASVALILVAAFLLASGATLIRSAAPALLPTLVEREDLAAANGRLHAGAMLSGSFAGPSLGGALYATSAASPVIAQTLSLIFSALCAARIPKTTTAPSPPRDRRSIRQEAADGVRWLASHRALRSIATGTVLLSAATGVLLAVLVIHTLDFLRLPPTGYGILISVYAIGSVAGSLLTSRLHRSLGTNRCLLASALLGAVTIGALALAPTPILAGCALFGLGVATMLWNTLAVTIRQELTPRHLLGRVTSAFNLVGIGVSPIAALLGGLIASLANTSLAIGVASLLCAIACVFLWRLPEIDQAIAAARKD
ncbi:MFS transporter [Serinicoccus sp. LYQ131]|uniref:MFS transporter n=1 Tax=Serinicoccus sp. LYQ131 TaxID=3378797 RepID=UPI0038521EE0